jgi:putative DNA methylase
MIQPKEVIPLSLKDAPSLIEAVLPVQKLSIDVYKERMSGSSQTLTALGIYWKGRKPLILTRACVIAALMPISSDIKADLEIFELLMGMDEISIKLRLGLNINDEIPKLTYKKLSSSAKRLEEMPSSIHNHIWKRVNDHIGTNASSIYELVFQLGIMRFGHNTVVGDAFSGSGQIPFEAARIGCDVFASDLNPVACLLTWASFNIVGAKKDAREELEKTQKKLQERVKEKIDLLGFETDGKGWRSKCYLYCLEIRCPSSGWMVPVLPSFIVSKGKRIVAKLIPDNKNKRYEIALTNSSEDEMKLAEVGTYEKDTVFHKVDGVEHRNKISTIRGDYTETINGKKINKNKLRQWEISDVVFRDEDIFNERLYAIQWVKDDGQSRPLTEFRSVTKEDELREEKLIHYVKSNLKDWQANGLVPSTKIEAGKKTDEPIRTRGWTYWHHLFNPRHLMVLAFMAEEQDPLIKALMPRVINNASRLCIWATAPIRTSKTIPGKQTGGASDNATPVFYNQALNTIYNYGCKASIDLFASLNQATKSVPDLVKSNIQILNQAANQISYKADLFITDPPYGDAVKYEEILEYFIAWLKNYPPKEFSNWTWDSRRALAIKGEDHDFKLSMVSAYKKMAECMPYNGMQVIMFTHQSGSIWTDMANIVWASGLQVTAAWYVVTETDSPLRDGQYVKGTILLVLRKRLQNLDTARDELAYELAEEVKNQVDLLTGLNKNTKILYKDENLFEDADLQMAGYAAALRVLTRYKTIDGIDMPQESLRPRVKGQTTMVDELIEFAVNIANEYLVPEGMDISVWEKSAGIERLYLKMLDMESKGIFTLSNYQNFAKAFKVGEGSEIMNEAKANKASLKSAKQLGKKGMNSADEFGPTILRSVLYAINLLEENKTKPEDVLHQLHDLVQDYYRERDRIISLADYISKKTSTLRPDESSNAVVLRDLVRHEKV